MSILGPAGCSCRGPPHGPFPSPRAELLFGGTRDAYAPFGAMGWGRLGPDESVREQMKNMDKYLPIFDEVSRSQGVLDDALC